MTRTMGDESATANRRILARALPSVLGETSAETVELVARAREGMEVSDLRRLLPLLEGWVSSYHPFVPPQVQGDFRRTLARQYLKLAFTRRGRSLTRIVLAIWGGRHQGSELMRTFLTLAVQRARLSLGYDPLASFEGGAP